MRAWGHRAKLCPLKRLNEMQETLGLRTPSANQAAKVTCPICGALAGRREDANRLKFTPNGRLVLISTLRGRDLTVIDTTTHKTIKRIELGRGAAGIVMQPDGSRPFVACTPDDYVAAWPAELQFGCAPSPARRDAQKSDILVSLALEEMATHIGNVESQLAGGNANRSQFWPKRNITRRRGWGWCAKPREVEPQAQRPDRALLRLPTSHSITMTSPLLLSATRWQAFPAAIVKSGCGSAPAATSY